MRLRVFPLLKISQRFEVGLVNHVAHYAQLRDILAPCNPFLSLKRKFQWSDELDKTFSDSKTATTDAIRLGVSGVARGGRSPSPPISKGKKSNFIQLDVVTLIKKTITVSTKVGSRT